MRTLVLDLDDTLIHSDWTRGRGWRTFKRPGAEDFLRQACSLTPPHSSCRPFPSAALVEHMLSGQCELPCSACKVYVTQHGQASLILVHRPAPF